MWMWTRLRLCADSCLVVDSCLDPDLYVADFCHVVGSYPVAECPVVDSGLYRASSVSHAVNPALPDHGLGFWFGDPLKT